MRPPGRRRSRTTHASQTRIYVNPTGQPNNLGDSVLRRAYLDALRRHGTLHVHVGDFPDYVTGLGLSTEDVVYRTRPAWLASAVLAPTRTRPVYAFNTGEMVLGPRFVYDSCWQLAAVLLSRLRGGGAVALGIALRADQPRWGLAHLRRILGFVDTVSWRDPQGAADVGIGTVAPDWAFVFGATTAELRADVRPRDVIAVSLRGDRAFPSGRWLETVRRLAALHGARIVVVNQMQHDARRCADLAELLGGERLDWTDGPHDTHESAVRDLYRRSIVVVSDRIHALILGLTEGAVPLGYTTGDPEKVARTFAAITNLPVALGDDAVPDVEAALDRADLLLKERATLLDALDDARTRLELLAHRPWGVPGEGRPGPGVSPAVVGASPPSAGST